MATPMAAKTIWNASDMAICPRAKRTSSTQPPPRVVAERRRKVRDRLPQDRGSGGARGAGDLAHAAALEVADRLDQLRLAVHHEGAVVRDPLAQRLAREQQQPRVAAPQAHRVAGAENGELAFGNLARSDARRALEDVDERVLARGNRHRHVGAVG